MSGPVAAKQRVVAVGQALSDGLKSVHADRNLLGRITIGLSQSLIVSAPPEISNRFRGRAVHVRFTQDKDRLVLCLKPDEKANHRWGEREYSGRKKLQIIRTQLKEGVTPQWPASFGATSPASAIWGPDGILRLHLPKNLNPVQMKGKRGPDKKPRKGSRRKPEIAKPVPPPPINPHQPALTREMMRKASVGHSTTLMVGVSPEIAEAWPMGYGIAARFKLEADRPVLFLRPDPTIGGRWGKKAHGDACYAIIKIDDVSFEDDIKKFKKVMPFSIAWVDDELRMKLPPERELKPPKKSNTTLYTIGDASGHHRKLHPELQPAQSPNPEPTVLPAAKTAPAHVSINEGSIEDRLRAAVTTLNEVKREMGDDLSLSVKDDGTVRASITKEFE